MRRVSVQFTVHREFVRCIELPLCTAKLVSLEGPLSRRGGGASDVISLGPD